MLFMSVLWVCQIFKEVIRFYLWNVSYVLSFLTFAVNKCLKAVFLYKFICFWAQINLYLQIRLMGKGLI